MQNIKILLFILFSYIISAQERTVFGIVKDKLLN